MKKIIGILVVVLLILSPLTAFGIEFNKEIKLENINNYFEKNDNLYDVINFSFVKEGYVATHPNIDIINIICNKEDRNIFLTLNVRGIIENRRISGETGVYYSFLLETDKASYAFYYCNNSYEYDIDNNEILDFVYYYSGSSLNMNFVLAEDDDFQDIVIEVEAMDIDLTQEPFPFIYYDVAGTIPSDIHIEIIKPEKALYLFNFKIRRFLLNFRKPLIIGDIDLKLNTTINSIPFKFELYINDELYAVEILDSFEEQISLNYLIDKFSFGKQIIKIIIYDTYGNKEERLLEVWKFF